jgi:hypothetical protein
MRANASKLESQLVDAATCINLVFSGSERKPSVRTFRLWQEKGMIPVVKIGHLTFFDPSEVRAALDKRCRINAVEFR